MDTSTSPRTAQTGDMIEVTPYGDIFLVDEVVSTNAMMFLVPIVTGTRWILDARGRAPFSYPLASWMRKLEYPDVE